MNIAFTIPVWLIWVLGVIGGIIVIALAVVGFIFIKAWSGFDWYR